MGTSSMMRRYRLRSCTYWYPLPNAHACADWHRCAFAFAHTTICNICDLSSVTLLQAFVALMGMSPTRRRSSERSLRCHRSCSWRCCWSPSKELQGVPKSLRLAECHPKNGTTWRCAPQSWELARIFQKRVRIERQRLGQRGDRQTEQVQRWVMHKEVNFACNMVVHVETCAHARVVYKRCSRTDCHVRPYQDHGVWTLR